MAPDRQKVIQSAEKLVARGRIQAAIDEYRKVLDRNPNDTSTLNRVGDLYARLNRMPKAIELFQQTAESFGRQGFFVKAIAIYKKIIRLDPGQIRAYEALAELYNRQGLTGDSLAQYQVVADYYQKHGDLDAAIGVYYDMVEIEPANPTRRLHLAGILQGEGRTRDAQQQYSEIARLMLEHSRGDDALRVLTEALDVDSENLDFVRQATHALQDAGFDRLGEKLLDAATEKNPKASVLRLDEPEAPAAASEEPAGEPADRAAAAEPAVEEREAPRAEEAVVEAEGAVEEPLVEESTAEEPTTEEATVEEAAVEEPTVEEASGEELEVTLEETLPEEPAVEEVAASASEEPVLELDLGEVEIGELEELGADAVGPAAPAGEVETGAAGEAEFTLDDVEAAIEEAAPEEAAPEEAAPEEAAPEVAEQEAPAPVVEEDLGFELDLDEIVEPPETIAREAAEAVEPSAGTLAEAEAEAELPEAPFDVELAGETIKLLIEAEVLARYGMDEMAIPILERILSAEPRHAEAMARLVRLQLRTDRTDEALVSANQLADIVAAEGAPKSWDEVRESLEERGFELVEGRFVGTPRAAERSAEAVTPAVEPAPAESEEAPVEEAAIGDAPEAEAAEPSTVDPSEIEAQVERSLEEMVAEAAADVAPRRTERPPTTEDVLGEVIDEIERETATQAAEPDVVAPEAAPLEAAEEPVAEEPAVELPVAEEPVAEELAVEPPVAEEPAVEPPVAEKPVAEEPAAEPPAAVDIEVPPGVTPEDEDESAEPASDEFVDLATELEAELLEEGGLEEDELLPAVREQSLEDIVEGFRQGMAETLAEGDYDTHYNLGVAYREMGLIDEAIGEFQLAAKEERYLVECCSLLASCFVEKNFHDLAIQWYVRGIDSPAIDPESRLGLLYELGTLLAALGEPEAARERFLEIYGVNSNYRDVVAKLAELSE